MNPIDEMIGNHEEALKAFALSLTHSESLTDDLMQETWLKSMTFSYMLQSLPLNKQKNWLFSVLKNLFFDHCRRLKRERQKLEEKEFYSQQEIKEIINWEPYLNLLPDKEREVILLKFWKGLNSKEIASLLSISDSTVRWHLSNGLKTLRNNYEKRWR